MSDKVLGLFVNFRNAHSALINKEEKQKSAYQLSHFMNAWNVE